MRAMFLCGILLLASGPAWAHVKLEIVKVLDQQGVQIQKPRESEPVTLQLKLVDGDTGKALTDKDLEIVHEKKFHLFAFDQALTGYQHEHPAFNKNAGVWTVSITFPRTGDYFVWADVTLKAHGGGHHRDEHGGQQYASSEIKVEGQSTAHLPVDVLETVTQASDRGSVLTLGRTENLKVGQEAMIILSFSREDGSQPEIKPYLGALAHVVLTTVDGTRLIHSHPMDHGGTPVIHTTFPLAGDYRAFAQFMDADVLRTVELAVRVRN